MGGLSCGTLAFVMFLSVAAGRSPWQDPSPHRVTWVEVAPGVSLEVLDWGGDGPPVVLLSGMGTTAHIYDDFAPKLAHGFHVWGITRRGFGASSQPSTGYDPTTLAHDLLSALDGIRLGKVSVVGHSLAGNEMTLLAADHPDRVDKLIYLDAAFDFTAFVRFMQDNPWPKLDPSTAADKSSPKAYLDWEERAFGYRRPEADLRATVVFGASGYERDVTPDSSGIFDQIIGSFQKLPYERLRGPALAIYAVPDGPLGLFPHRFAAMDEKDKALARRMAEATAQRAKVSAQAFQRAVHNAQVLEIHGSEHYVFLTHEGVVLTAVESFLREPPIQSP